MNRAEKRRLKREKENPIVKDWVEHPSPKQLKQGSGWFGEFDRVYRQNDEYVVMIRDVHTEWGVVQHACMRNADNSDIPWREKQRIKNELFGHDRIAVEVFPAESELVDGADMYHIWILDNGFILPFSLKE